MEEAFLPPIERPVPTEGDVWVKIAHLLTLRRGSIVSVHNCTILCISLPPNCGCQSLFFDLMIINSSLHTYWPRVSFLSVRLQFTQLAKGETCLPSSSSPWASTPWHTCRFAFNPSSPSLPGALLASSGLWQQPFKLLSFVSGTANSPSHGHHNLKCKSKSFPYLKSFIDGVWLRLSICIVWGALQVFQALVSAPILGHIFERESSAKLTF